MEGKLVSKRVDKCPKCGYGIGFKPYCETCRDTKKVLIEIYASPYVPEAPKEEKKIVKLKKTKRGD